jgi:HAD superfamily hydrolase (TIGR01484 family)
LKPLSLLSAQEAKNLAGVLFDLDDTLLDHGVLTESAYSALWALSRGGLRLFAVTGRPWGWADVVARQWPIAGAIAENGAVGVYREGGVLRRWDPVEEATRRSRRVRLARVYEDLRSRFGMLRMSDDTYARVSDIAIDIAESQRVPDDIVAAVTAAAHELGVMTFVSTVHLHLTLDAADKASGTLALLAHAAGEDPFHARSRYAFLGDSPNDAACFAAFETTAGVKNVEPYAAHMAPPPRYVASAERGAGFAEIARRILDLRQ